MYIDNAMITLRGVNKEGKVKIGLKNMHERMNELVFSHDGTSFYSLNTEYENLMLLNIHISVMLMNIHI